MIGVNVLPAAAVPLLYGLVGSHAYGLARPDSDRDYRGVFAHPTARLLVLNPPKDSYERIGNAVDVAWWEARKTIQLVLAGNPTFTELLWLPEYLHVTDWGLALVSMRKHLSARDLIRRTYLGYATGQFRQLSDRGDGTFSSDTAHRTAKHGLHLARLLIQGYNFWRTGDLTVKLNPEQAEYVTWIGDVTASGDLKPAQQMLAEYEHRFDTTISALPVRPDYDKAEAWLLALRKDHLL